AVPAGRAVSAGRACWSFLLVVPAGRSC
nr:hypothetical protein [Tanacetum cinerariifolium]